MEATQVESPLANFTEKAVICNINPQEMPLLFRTYQGPLRLNSPKPGEEFALTEIKWVKAYADRGDYEPLRPETRAEFIIGAREIAEDLCNEINSAIPTIRNSFRGVFVCVDDKPTRQELDNAKKRLEETMKQLVSVGDVEWARYHRYEYIPDSARVAAKFLGLEKEWAYQPEMRVDCPACGAKLPNQEVAVCKSCGAILDREKAAKFGLIKEEKGPSEVIVDMRGVE